jgi:hypothetical protein
LQLFTKDSTIFFIFNFKEKIMTTENQKMFWVMAAPVDRPNAHRADFVQIARYPTWAQAAEKCYRCWDDNIRVFMKEVTTESEVAAHEFADTVNAKADATIAEYFKAEEQ